MIIVSVFCACGEDRIRTDDLLTARQFLYQILKKNKAKFQYMLDELSPRDFVNTYLKLIPYIITMRHLQQFDVSELSRDEVKEVIKDLIDAE